MTRWIETERARAAPKSNPQCAVCCSSITMSLVHVSRSQRSLSQCSGGEAACLFGEQTVAFQDCSFGLLRGLPGLLAGGCVRRQIYGSVERWHGHGRIACGEPLTVSKFDLHILCVSASPVSCWFCNVLYTVLKPWRFTSRAVL